MNRSTHRDPAEDNWLYRFFYRDWRPTRLGRYLNRFWGWWSGLGLPPRRQATLETRGRVSGRTRATPVVIVSLDGARYLVAMLGPHTEWVRNAEAAQGQAVIRQGRRRPVRLLPVAVEQRAPVLREYVRAAPGGRRHFPVAPGAPLSAFEGIAGRYPVFRIDPA